MNLFGSLAMAAAVFPIRLLISVSNDKFAEEFAPRYTRCSTASRAGLQHKCQASDWHLDTSPQYIFLTDWSPSSLQAHPKRATSLIRHSSKFMPAFSFNIYIYKQEVDGCITLRRSACVLHFQRRQVYR